MSEKPTYEDLEKRVRELEKADFGRKRAEESLLKSELLLSTHLLNTPVGAISWDLDFKAVEWNPAAEAIFGYTKEEATGKHATELILPEDMKELVDDVFQDLLSNKGGTRSTNENITKDGRQITCDWYNTPQKDADGRVVGVASLLHDITERKQTEEALRISEEKLQLIIDTSPVGICTVDPLGNFVTTNLAYEQMVGYAKEELRGLSFFDVTHPDDRPNNKKLFQDMFSLKTTDFFVEKRYIRKDGTNIDVAVHASGIMDAEGNARFGTAFVNDITERKRSEQEKKKLQAQLIQAQKMESIGNLAGGIAHDFNNILSSVIGFTELSLDEVEKGTHIEDNLQEVYTAGKRAKDLVRQILAFARQSEEKLKPIRVDTIATEVLKFIRSSIPTTIEIKQNIESDSLIMGNATQVHQILMNLFTNSAHAMEDKGGILEFSLKDVVMDRGVNREKLDLKPGNYVEIKVSDTGLGIAPEIIGSIFEPYFTTKCPGEGTGMGLAMVNGIIESYGGKISVNSKPGQGTLFVIYLPVTRKRQENRPYQSEELPTGTERILFVDDEGPIAKMGGQVLERLGYIVSIRTSSIEALELFRTKPNDFDLVITDMTMPNMTGDNLANELMKIRPDIPVIICTGYSKKISDETALKIGIKAFAHKPIVRADLAKTVRKVLDEAKGLYC